MRRLIIIVIISALGFTSLNILNTGAQAEPTFLVTWKTATYTPPYFTGKVLAGAGSPLMIAFEIIENGKLVDLSRQTIYWYLDNNFVKGGQGVQNISFIADKNAAGGSHAIRIQLPDFRGDLLIKTIEVPVVQPEVVIEAPFPEKKISTSKVKLFGRPYFFNVKTPSKLNFSWKAAGEPAETSGGPESLDLTLGQNIPNGTTIPVALSINNPENIFEAASKAINLTFSP